MSGGHVDPAGCRANTRTLPIVFNAVGDPVSNSFIARIVGPRADATRILLGNSEAVASALGRRPGRAVSENGRLRQGTGGYPRGDRRRRGLVLPALSSSRSTLGRSRRDPVRFPYSHVDSHWVLREVDPVRSRWEASGPNSVCPTCQTRSTSKVRSFDFGDCGPPI